MKKNNEKIDIVIPWVDGNDEEWIKEKNIYCKKNNIKVSDSRYRDWGLLKYWFRGIEKFAPWVNKIYFVTWGHIPNWLNIENSKLVVVKHSDYMPKEYLPTFNSNTILMNLHRIKDLSENFIVFNDDFYIINKTVPTDFFIDNMPCDNIALNVHCPKKSNNIQNICFNDTAIINEYFNFRKTFKKNKRLWFNIHNGKEILRTLALMKCPRYPGFYYHHMPQGYKKSYFEKVWELENNYLDKVSKNKFRTTEDVNEWLIKDWQIVEGNITIRKKKIGKPFFMQDSLMPKQGEEIVSFIKNQKKKCIAINDGLFTGEKCLQYIPNIVKAFDSILPEKSSFEK